MFEREVVEKIKTHVFVPQFFPKFVPFMR